MNIKTKIMISLLSVAVVAAAVTAIVLAATDKGTFVGTVTENGTNNPIAGVSATDGRNVVKTNEKGGFEINGWRKSHFVTVTVPSGYETPLLYPC